jgi:hypothetical protein
MRRSATALSIAIALTGAACEDGPSQTFSPAPPNAGELWNNGNTAAVVNDAGASLTATFSGSSKTEICSGAELQAQWAKMVAQPIVPPYEIAGVNIAGISYQSLTVEQAENGVNGALFPATAPGTTMLVPGASNPPTRLCQGQNLGTGADSGDLIGGTLLTAWGQNQEFTMEWAVNTHKDYYNQINPGYTGSMTWTYQNAVPCTAPQGCDGKMHTYVWAIGRPITIDGKPFLLDWNGYNSPADAFYQEADVLYRGITLYFTPDLYDNLPSGVLCRDTGRCPAFPTGNDYVHPILGFRTISMYWDMDPPVLPQPSGSTPHDAYFFNIKYAPYSPAVSILDMSTAAGPTGSLNPIGDMNPGKDCELGFGTAGSPAGTPGTYGHLSTNCINVFKSATTNTLASEKVLGNLAHDDQNFTFSVVGINQNYRPPQLDIGGSRQFDVIHDGELPAADAVAVDFTLDVRANGPIMNDRYPTTESGVFGRDNHGSGVVWREFARMVQADLASKYAVAHNTTPRPIHDPACLFPLDYTVSPPGALPPGFNPATWHAAAGCTGFEGWIDEAYPNVLGTTGLPVDAADPTQTDPLNVWDLPGILGNFVPDDGLRPGTPYVAFCMDPGIYDFCGYPSAYGQANDLLDASLAAVTQIMGDGDPSNLPSGVGDRRYFFEFFTRAHAKYFTSGAALHTGECGGPAATLPAICSPAPAASAAFDPVPYFGDAVVNTDDFFFDSFGGNANRAEFVQYQFADTTHDPIGFNISMLLIGSNLQEEHFYRRLDREERAIFEAMGNQDGKAAGQASWGLLRDSTNTIVKDEWGIPQKNADVFITNIAGSPAIAGGPWSAAADSMGNPIPVGTANAYDPCFPTTPSAMVMKSAYYCATHLDTDCGIQAPTNPDGTIVTRENGEPLLAGYCGIWNGSPFSLGSANMELVNTDFSAQNQQYEEEQEVIVPNFANPYDPTTKNTPIKVLVPWLPDEDGVGFAVPSTGQTNVFVQTASLDFSGQIVVPVFDYLPVTAPGTQGANSTFAAIQGIESGDFLGDVFLCYDIVTGANRAGTGQPGDVLAAHMYTPAQDILAWIANHPQAQANCNIIVRYSPFNNYPDYITSLANGVTVDIDQGEGFGRVVDITLFVPGSGAPAQP